MSISNIFLALLPLFTSILVIRGMIYYAQRPHSARNISPSYFAAVALLFALFASLIFGEVWTRVSHINSLMLQQASALRGLLRATDNLPEISQSYRDAVDQYIAGIQAMEAAGNADKKSEQASASQEDLSNQTFRELYRLSADTVLMQKYPVVHQLLLGKTDVLRSAWFERRELLKQRILPEKMLILFLMGFFTQVAVALSHLGNDRAVRDTVWLFSLVFFAAMAILVSIDDTELSRHFISIAVLNDVY